MKPRDGRVLVVDDDGSVRLVLSEMLRRAGFTADAVGGVAAAQERFAAESYDAALVDLHMPGADGFELLAWMEEHASGTVPVVLSGTRVVDDAVKALRRSVYDFIMKPILDFEDLFGRVQRAVDYGRLRRERDAAAGELQVQAAELSRRLEQLGLAHGMLQSHARVVTEDLVRAHRVLYHLLPSAVPHAERLCASVLYRPAGRVGGDWYDVRPLDDRRAVFWVADVCGQGVSAALLTVYLRDSVEELRSAEAGRPFEPGFVLGELNARMARQFGDTDLFAAAVLAVVDSFTGEVTLAAAGGMPVLVRRARGPVQVVQPRGGALGIDPGAVYLSERVTLSPGDALVVFTDGAVEVRSPAGSVYGLEGLAASLGKASGSVESLAAQLGWDLLGFARERLFDDDVTVLALGLGPQRSAFAPVELPGPEVELSAGEGGLLPPVPTASLVPLAVGAVLESSDGGRSFLAVPGAATWREAARVRDAAMAALGASSAPWVVVDLAAADHVDSTFLGVLHELAGRFAGRPAARLEVQAVSRPALQSMADLGLHSVLGLVRHEPVPLPPEMARAVAAAPSREELGRLVRRAHEQLVAADPRNADRFGELLRRLHEGAAHGVEPSGPGQHSR